jgi:hypothetical protein
MCGTIIKSLEPISAQLTRSLFSTDLNTSGHMVAQLVEKLRYKPVGFQMVSLQFYIDIILPVALRSWGLTQPLTEMSTRNISWGYTRKWPVRKADNLNNFRNPQGLLRPVMGKLYLLNILVSANFITDTCSAVLLYMVD